MPTKLAAAAIVIMSFALALDFFVVFDLVCYISFCHKCVIRYIYTDILSSWILTKLVSPK